MTYVIVGLLWCLIVGAWRRAADLAEIESDREFEQRRFPYNDRSRAERRKRK